MRFLFAFLFTALTLISTSPATAVPVTSKSAAVTGEVTVPFDPPLKTPIRFRFEKIDEKDGKSVRSWMTYDAVFEDAPVGYRLAITPIDGDDDREKDKAREAIHKRLDQLENRPFVVEIDDELSISGVRDIDRYWNEMIGAVRATAKDPDIDASDRKALEVAANFLADMPKEARLAKLLEPVQPLIEFAGVQIEDASEPIPFQTDMPSPFGGQIKMDGTISVLRFDEDEAEFGIVSEISRASLEALLKSVVDRVAGQIDTAKSSSEMHKEIAAIKRFEVVDRSNYRLTSEDGMLISYSNERSVVVEAEGKTQRNQKTMRLTRIP